jgi:hypothetical protein
MLRLLKDADPAAGKDLDEWASSEAGLRVHTRIVARRQHDVWPPPERPRAPRVTLVAAGAFVAVAVVVVGLAVGLRESPVVQSTTTGALVVVADRTEVLARVVDAVEARGGTEYPISPGKDPASYATRAGKLGIILASDLGWAASPGPLSRSEYALWIWRAFADRLPQVRAVSLSDLGAVSEETKSAVSGVVGAGILDAANGGLFYPDRALSTDEARQALARLEQALGLSGNSGG